MISHFKRNEEVKKCGVCLVVLTPKNSYYPKRTNLLCEKHFAEKYQEYAKSYSMTAKGKKAIAEASTRAYANHKEKWLARAKARYAVQTGKLIKPRKCEICELVKPLQGHHEDYSKPLEVIWLCSRCHADTHNALKDISSNL